MWAGLSEIVPGEEPYAAAKRLATEWNRTCAIEAGYRYLNEYYDR